MAESSHDFVRIHEYAGRVRAGEGRATNTEWSQLSGAVARSWPRGLAPTDNRPTGPSADSSSTSSGGVVGSIYGTVAIRQHMPATQWGHPLGEHYTYSNPARMLQYVLRVHIPYAAFIGLLTGCPPEHPLTKPHCPERVATIWPWVAACPHQRLPCAVVTVGLATG